MFTVISLLILVYLMKGKDVKPLLQRLGNINWHNNINALIDKLRPWALKVGRVAARPMLQFYYVMRDEHTSTLDRVLIYAAIIYTIVPGDLLPRSVFKFAGLLDDGIAVLYVYNKIKKSITPEINSKVNDKLDEWFGVEYEMIEQ